MIGRTDCVRMLVESGADKDSRNNVRALDSRRLCMSVYILRALCMSVFENALPRFRVSSGTFALLMSSALIGLCHILPLVCQTQDGYTALIWAAETGHIACVRLLVEGGADMCVMNDVCDRPFCLKFFVRCCFFANILPCPVFL
jgi:ankyrin repeat protein